MDYKTLYLSQISGHYCTSKELCYSTVYKHFLDAKQLSLFNEFKDNSSDDFSNSLIKLDLKSFNSNSIYFSKCVELTQSTTTILDLLMDDLQKEDKPLAIRNINEILRSRIFSEVEGTLNIENVPTTRKRVTDLLIKGEQPKNKNDQIIKNMGHAIEFVFAKPEFNKENLYKLYNLLSEEQLDIEHQLKENDLYRYDDVFIDNYVGCPVNKLDECMDSLFTFINENLDNNELKLYLPHIAHYYILYIHPYFDFNGRTARMVSLWVSLLLEMKWYPPFISDAINQTKNKYYSALSESRNARNDMTYFLLYMSNLTISYFLAYQNVEHIEKTLLSKEITLSALDKDYIKRIIVSYSGPFSYNDFTKWNHIDITKQGALKILNQFTKYGILEEVITNGSKKFFRINEDMIIYKTDII